MGKSLVIKGADFSENGFKVGSSGILPLSNCPISVVNTQAGYKINTTNNFRMASTSNNAVNDISGAILVPSGAYVQFKGLKGIDGLQPALRFDYCYYNNSSILCAETSVSHNAPNLIGTCSNFDENNYFPLNTEGLDSFEFVNTYGADYYFSFAFTGRNKNETLVPSNYNISYFVSEKPKWESLNGRLVGGAIGIVPSDLKRYGRVTLNNSERICSSSESGGILIPNGKKMHIKGLYSSIVPSLRIDAAYYTSSEIVVYTDQTTAPSNIVGTLSNGNANNYFPLNSNGNANDCILANTYGNDYYFGLSIAAINKTSDINLDNYELMYYIE